MSKVSAEFGALISGYLREHGLTYRAAALQSQISAAYWKDMADGRVPSAQAIEKVCAAFPDLDKNALLAAAGYAADYDPNDAVAAVECALRNNQSLTETGRRQILEFVREVAEGKHE